MNNYSKLILPFLVCGLFLLVACLEQAEPKNEISMSKGASTKSVRYFEFTVTCKGDVTDVLLVEVDLGSRHESFGVIGAGPNGRDGGKTTMGAPVSIGKDLVVRWRIDKPDLVGQTNRTVIKTEGFLPNANVIDSFELIYFGDKNWELSAYDGLFSDENRSKIEPTTE